MAMDRERFREIVRKTKARLLKMHFDSQVGHIGGNLSVLDGLLYVYHNRLGKNGAVVLSKGHSAGALYAALWSIGALPEEKLAEFHQDGSKLAGHPVAGWTDHILFTTGSLGHGLSVSAGLALGKRLKGEEGDVYCFMSDGEWQEGSNWEALIFAVHHRLDNLKIYVDSNGLQGFGAVHDIASMDSLAERFAAFNAAVTVIGGHSFEEHSAVPSSVAGRPQVVVMKTVKGHGVSFMENRYEWHYLPMNREQYEQAALEVSGK